MSESPTSPQTPSPSGVHAARPWWHFIPIFVWLKSYQGGWLRADLFAGLTLAVYAVPVSLAYASLAGLPAQTGLYCYLLGGIVYAVFGSSKHLAIGPTSAISLLLGVTLARITGGNDPERQIALASIVTLLMALIFMGAWALRLSVIVNFFSDSLLAGFKAGAALVIASTQIPKLIGVQGGGDNFFERIAIVAGQAGGANLAVLAFGLGALGLLLAGEKYWPGRPSAFVVVVLSLVIAGLPGVAGFGLPEARPLQAGLPHFTWAHSAWPSVSHQEWRELARLAFACFLLAFIESISAARVFAAKHGYDVDPRQELLALGQVNLIAALGQGFPSAGGLSQSAVNEKAGARTPLALIAASAGVGIILLYLTGFFRHLPQAVLAAIVLMSVKGLVDIGELRHLWRASRIDFYAALAAFIGVLVLGILDGVIAATIVSLLMLLASTARPHVAFLGRIPGTIRFSDRARHPDNETLPGVLAFRVESSLYYFNVEHVLETVIAELDKPGETYRAVVCDLSTSPNIDLSGARMLIRLHQTLASKGIRFTVAEAHAEVRDLLREEGFEAMEGHISRKESLDAAICRLLSPGRIQGNLV